MPKIFYLFFILALVWPFFVSFDKAKAASDIEITTNATEHTVVMPYEKSFLFKATIKNNGSSTATIQSKTESNDIPKEWHVLAPTGRYQLEPGETADFIAVFEPSSGNPGQQAKEESVTVPVSFSWEGGSKKFDITVKTKTLSLQDAEETAKVDIKVLDKNKKQISGAAVSAILPSGIEEIQATKSGDDYLLALPSANYLEKMVSQYNTNHSNKGYYLQVSAKGYQSYFEANFSPKDGDQKTVRLESLEQIGEYQASKTIESGYSIWWIRSSTDGKYLAISQGAHDNPGQKPPSSSKVILADNGGNKLWENTTGGECWGLDIASNGKYVAAGCHDGKVYLWDQSGQEVWVYDSKMGADFRVRWVKFSPDGNYLLTGPVNGKPEESGLIEVKSGKLLWSFYTGDWLREGRFSSDGQIVYLSSSNGTIYALGASSGQKKWLGLGEHVIPFMLGISQPANLAVSTGKGRAFTALDLASGKNKWQVVVDQTITAAQMAENGSMVGSTVGGMSYGLDANGNIKWVRKYGGVGHNGAYYAKNGQYALLGGPNPTLFDSNGNILWQREKNKAVQMTSVQEQNTGGANEVWMSEDGSLIVLGGDDGKITFYTGSLKKGQNDYDQSFGVNRVSSGGPNQPDQTNADSRQKPSSFPWIMIGAVAIAVIAIVIVALFLVRKKSAHKTS